MALYNEIIEGIDTSNLNELEIARLLYIELGKRVSFSTKLQNTDISTMSDMIKEEVDVETFDEKEVTCVRWAKLYSHLLSKYGIKNRIIDLGHQFVEFETMGYKWVADATDGAYTDLSRIHNGDNIECFGLSLYQHNPDKVHNRPIYNQEVHKMLRQIDVKLGYNDEKYKDLVELKELIINIKNGTFNINDYVKGDPKASDTEKKLQFLFAKLGVLDEGYYEAKDYVYYLEKALLSKEELENVSSKELKRTNEEGSVNILQVITLHEQDNYHYYILCPNMPVKEVDQENLIKLALLGYGKEDNKEIPGLIYPKDFTPGKKMTGLKYKMSRIVNEYKIKNSTIAEYDNVVAKK